jgi:hypothetical protein
LDLLDERVGEEFFACLIGAAFEAGQNHSIAINTKSAKADSPGKCRGAGDGGHI